MEWKEANVYYQQEAWQEGWKEYQAESWQRGQLGDPPDIQVEGR